MYDNNGFSDRLIRATEPTEKKDRNTREKTLQSAYEKCRQSNVGSFGQYIRSKITRDTLRRCGISNIDLRYIELSSESQLYHGGTSWEPGKPYVFTGSIDRLANSQDLSKSHADDMGVECVRLFQLDSDRHLLAVNRSAIEEVCREWYILGCPPTPPPSSRDQNSNQQQLTHPDKPCIRINGHGTIGDLQNDESTAGENEKNKRDKTKVENGQNESSETKEKTSTAESNSKDKVVAFKSNENMACENSEQEAEKQRKEQEELFVRIDGLSLVDSCFQNERETEFYNVEGIAYEDASSGTSKDILLYHTSASASISSKDILLFDTSNLRLKQELIVPRRSAKHLVRGQNGYLRCNEPARPRAPPSIRNRPSSGGTGSRSGTDTIGTTKSWAGAETSTRDTKL